MMQCCCPREFEVCSCTEIAPDQMTVNVFGSTTFSRYDTDTIACGWQRCGTQTILEVENSSFQASIPVTCNAGTQYTYQSGDVVSLSATYSRSYSLRSQNGGSLPCCEPPFGCAGDGIKVTTVTVTAEASGGGDFPGIGDYGGIQISAVSASTQVRRGTIAFIPPEVREYYGGEGWTANPDHYYRNISASISFRVQGTEVTTSSSDGTCNNPDQSDTETTSPFFSGIGYGVGKWFDLGPSCDVRNPGTAMAPATAGFGNPTRPQFTPYITGRVQQFPDVECPDSTYCSCTREGFTCPGDTDENAYRYAYGVSL